MCTVSVAEVAIREGADESRATVLSLNRPGFGGSNIASCYTCCWPGGLVMKPRFCVSFGHLACLARSENSNLGVDAAGAPVICVATLVAHCLQQAMTEPKFLSCLLSDAARTLIYMVRFQSYSLYGRRVYLVCPTDVGKIKDSAESRTSLFSIAASQARS